MAIAVAYWAMGIGNSFTKFEKIEFVSIYADPSGSNPVANGVTAQATTTATANGQIDPTITIVTGGSGYTSRPAVSFNDPTGTGATATAVITNGAVTSITLTSQGQGYTSPTVTIGPPTFSSYAIRLQLKNTGTAAATINNVFINGRPISAIGGGAYTNLVSNAGGNGMSINVGSRINNPVIYLPTGATSSGGTYGSGDYVEVEIETTAGRTYSNTVVIP